MASYSDQHLALINQLLEDKDRLLAEKDELVASKDKLWREMHSIMRERDAGLDYSRHGLRTNNQRMMSDGPADTTSLKDEIKRLKERNLALEDALRDLLDQEQGSEETTDDSKSEPCETRLRTKYPSPDEYDSKGQLEGTLPTPQASLSSSREYREEVSRSKSNLPSFTFSALISISSAGAYELGNINAVAPSVLQSINSQIATHITRVHDGKNPASPSPQYRSTDCFHGWMMHFSGGTRWTVDSPRCFACASCFNARRACMLWLGSGQWALLPLPPAPRRAEATWEDADFYVYKGGHSVTSTQFEGVWEDSKVKQRGKA